MLILLADKDPYDLQALQAELQAPDREVVIVADGESLVQEAAKRSPDVVVVGSSLGQMGGFAVSRELKTMADLERIPEPRVIVIIERQADAWVAGWSRCDAFLCKPVDPAELEDLVTPSAAAAS